MTPLPVDAKLICMLTPRHADCHPKQVHCANGLCRACYDRACKLKRRGGRPAKPPVLVKKDPALIKEQGRTATLLRYGLSPEQYEQMLTSQGGVCAICATPPRLKRLAVDHNHTTGKVRGLLCSHCNTGLGQFKDSPDVVRAAITYLSTHGGAR